MTRISIGAGSTVASAVAASAAIPGVLAPVTIGDVEYVDGGVFSPTNADVLAGAGLDLVVVVAPMSGAPGRYDRPVRTSSNRKLLAEESRLRESGAEVVRFEPGNGSARAMGPNPLDKGRGGRVVRSAFFEAGRTLAVTGLAGRLRTAAGSPHPAPVD